jgi:hypothetical protein
MKISSDLATACLGGGTLVTTGLTCSFSFFAGRSSSRSEVEGRFVAPVNAGLDPFCDLLSNRPSSCLSYGREYSSVPR